MSNYKVLKGKKMRVKISERKNERSARIRPRGFWAESVTVFQDHAFGSEDWVEPAISWSFGGHTDENSTYDAAQALIEALGVAQKIYLLWKADRSALEYVTPEEN